MEQIHADRLLRLADMVEFDGEPFDYGCTSECIIPRSIKISGFDYEQYDERRDYFGLTDQEYRILTWPISTWITAGYIIPQNQPTGDASREEIAEHIRDFIASKGFKVTNARLSIKTAIEEEVAIGHHQS